MPKTKRLRKGATPLLRKYIRFAHEFATAKSAIPLVLSANRSQLRTLQELLRNVKTGQVPINPNIIKGYSREKIGRGLETFCRHYDEKPEKLKSLLLGNQQTGGFALGAIAKFALPIVLDSLLSRGGR